MGIARNIARLIPNGSGLLPNANIEAVAASKLTGQVALATQVSGTLPDANAPSGSVIQVVNFQENGRYEFSGDWHNTPLTAQITPLSSSSRIYASIHLGRVGHYGQNTLAFRMIKNGSLVAVGAPYGSRLTTSGVIMRITTDSNHTQGLLHLSFVDTANTTSAITYTLQAQVEGAGTWYLNRNGSNTDSNEGYNSTSQSNITLMEIAA